MGIVYQKADDTLPRAQVLSEIITNWLPTVVPASAAPLTLVRAGSFWRYDDTGLDPGTAWRRSCPTTSGMRRSRS